MPPNGGSYGTSGGPAVFNYDGPGPAASKGAVPNLGTSGKHGPYAVLRVSSLSGNDVPVGEQKRSGLCDPYLFCYAGGKKFKTDVQRGTMNPNWPSLNWSVELTRSDVLNGELRVELWDWNSVGQDVLIGCATVPLRSLFKVLHYEAKRSLPVVLAGSDQADKAMPMPAHSTVQANIFAASCMVIHDMVGKRWSSDMIGVELGLANLKMLSKITNLLPTLEACLSPDLVTELLARALEPEDGRAIQVLELFQALLQQSATSQQRSLKRVLQNTLTMEKALHCLIKLATCPDGTVCIRAYQVLQVLAAQHSREDIDFIDILQDLLRHILQLKGADGLVWYNNQVLLRQRVFDLVLGILRPVSADASNRLPAHLQQEIRAMLPQTSFVSQMIPLLLEERRVDDSGMLEGRGASLRLDVMDLLRTIQASMLSDDAAEQLKAIAQNPNTDQLSVSFASDMLSKRRHQGVDSDVLEALEFVRQERRREIEEAEMKKEKWYSFNFLKCKACSDCGSSSGKERKGFRKVFPQSGR